MRKIQNRNNMSVENIIPSPQKAMFSYIFNKSTFDGAESDSLHFRITFYILIQMRIEADMAERNVLLMIVCYSFFVSSTDMRRFNMQQLHM